MNPKLFVLLSFICLSVSASGQPGWRDFTQRYSYTILDKDGKEISFKKNKHYSIMVDTILYRAPFIPQDSLIPALRNHTSGFENQIRINDCSLSIPQKDVNSRQKELEIRIIYKRDTMYICQPSGTGSFRSLNIDGKPATPSPDFTFHFIAGHYFFPHWAKNLLDNMPAVNGGVKIVNLEQRHFIVPATIYDSICYLSPIYDNRQKHYDNAERLIVNNFKEGYFSFKRQVEATKFDRSIHPFGKPQWGYRGTPYFPTKAADEYLGVLDLSYDTLNWSYSRGMLVRFNYKENEMKIWSPAENLIYSSTGPLYKDTFNNLYYNRSIIYDTACKEPVNNCRFMTQFYRSADEGKTWEEDEILTRLYQKHEFRQFEFLDQHHALIFKLDKLKLKGKNYDIQQGTYYLLKDLHIIDSIKTPDDVHYNNNYNHYDYSIKNDTILLGNWSYDEYYTMGQTKYYQPMIKKSGNRWRFQTVEKIFSRTQSAPQIGQVAYKNFKIVNSTLLLNTGNGSLDFHTDLVGFHRKGLILEKDKEIYVIGLKIGTLFSFDSGYNWFVYPLPLEKGSDYRFLTVDEQGIISHLKSSWEKNGYAFNKVFHQLQKVD